MPYAFIVSGSYAIDRYAFLVCVVYLVCFHIYLISVLIVVRETGKQVRFTKANRNLLAR